jgi:hypothetical protein
MESNLEKAGAKFVGHILVRYQDTKEVLVDKFNQIHFENMSEALALSLADRSTGHIQAMVFGNGGSTVSGTGAVTYFPPNVTGQTAQLYNQTHYKIVDDMSPLNLNPSENNLRVQHTQNATYTDIVVTCTLDVNEPPSQSPFDNATNTEDPYVFDELGLKSFAAIENTGKLLTHVIFHPVQKSANRTIEVVYTIRIFMS